MNLFKDIITVALAIAIGIFAGCKWGQRPVKQLMIDIESIEKKRDSLLVLTDTLYAKIDFLYAENTKKEVEKQIVFITKLKEIEIEKYLKMDTAGRVQHFHEWVVDSTNRFKQITSGN